MPSFRSPKAQADHAIRQKLAIGSSRHDNRDDGMVHSLGTARTYAETLGTFSSWLKEERLGDLRSVGREEALRYLAHRSEEVGQQQLDKDRQAIQIHLGQQLPRGMSEIETIKSATRYTKEQLQMVREHQSPPHAMATEIIQRCGLRSHELLTLRQDSEQPRSTHREWRSDLHAGQDGPVYTVVGKGGLCREVVIPADIAARLEAVRLPEPVIIVDRGIWYKSCYAVGGGQAWSASFSAASRRVLGWSDGGHQVRGCWARDRVAALQEMGYSIADAKAVCSQNLGHFRSDVLEYYL
ncbi:site-specific integrase [Geomonas sp. Red875]|uniref:Site-specific integrase n=2 Tax=Geomesophilobacter sediminis TaxID=2798584 RepID=A0A8J7IX77_9BACT|nr:site-specific integrase [Geomesophilobacter sediminis]